MAIRRFPGTPTADLEQAWEVVALHDGWKIEVHKQFWASVAQKFLFWRAWNPVRLLGPDSTLWASAATVEEMREALPSLISECGAKQPLLTREDLRKIGEALGSVLLSAATRKLNVPVKARR